MLPSKNRLLDRRDFERVFSGGTFYCSGPIAIRVFQRNDRVKMRVGFVVGKKKMKLAVDRNRLKRQLREVVRSILPPSLTGFDVVVMYRSDNPHVHATELLRLLRKVFSISKIISPLSECNLAFLSRHSNCEK